MFRLIVLMAMGITLLTGCDALTGKITPESVAAEIAKDCGIAVTLADIAALILQEPASAGIAVMAKEVCDAFNAKKLASPQAAAGGTVQVHGVVVHYTSK